MCRNLRPQRNYSSHYVSHSKMSTRLAVSELSQSDVLRLVYLSQDVSQPSPPTESPLKSNLSRCITKPSNRHSQVTTLDSTLRTSPSRMSVVDILLPTAKKTQPRKPNPSPLRSLSSTIQVRSATSTPQYSIAILPILHANSKNSNKRSTNVLDKFSKRAQSSSNPEMPPLSPWSQPAQCVLKLSVNTHLLDVSPFVTCVKPSPSESSRPSISQRQPERPQNPQPRQPEERRERNKRKVIDSNKKKK